MAGDVHIFLRLKGVVGRLETGEEREAKEDGTGIVVRVNRSVGTVEVGAADRAHRGEPWQSLRAHRPHMRLSLLDGQARGGEVRPLRLGLGDETVHGAHD